MMYTLGIDIGSSATKLTLTDSATKPVYRDLVKTSPNPYITINHLLERLEKQISLSDISGAALSGTGAKQIAAMAGWGYFSDGLALVTAATNSYPDIRTVICSGGQTAHVIELEHGANKPWKVFSNPLCAAGTGHFLQQQCYRLGIQLDEMARLAASYTEGAPRIATRCSVFAKSDLIHLQQKGVPVEAMLKSLCESIARMIASLKKDIFLEPILFTGGMAANPSIRSALEAELSARNNKPVSIRIADFPQFTQSEGLALLARNTQASIKYFQEESASKKYHTLPGLEETQTENEPLVKPVIDGSPLYLGIDVGSTSTKAAVVNSQGEVIIKDYIMTAGRPVDAIKQVFANLLSKGAGEIKIAAAGVTGSGRYLVGNLIGADLVKNEITAQVRAAQELDSDADIIEIGGQDSKLVIKRNGIVADYQMNKACAAGTGSFIDELADMLGISVKNGDFARMAFKAPHTIDLGTRCAAFMGQAVASAQQQGVAHEIIAASLSRSIVSNYLSKVVGSRKLGHSVILTGAVFYNQAVIAAFKQRLSDKRVLVAHHREVSGAIGAAMLAMESINGQNSSFKGFTNVINTECNLSTFLCTKCDNNCTITRMKLAGAPTSFFGSRCDLYDATINKTKVQTPFDIREKLLFADYKPYQGSGPLVGVPRALLVYDYAPLLLGFLNKLGVRVLVSDKTTHTTMEKAIALSYSDSCFPVKLLHGHIDSLSRADYILYPCVIRLGEKREDKNQKYACPLVQASPFIVRNVMADISNRLLSPIIDFSLGKEETVNNFAKAAVAMGFSQKEGVAAAMAGIVCQQGFEAQLQQHGRQTLDEISKGGKTGVVVMARSYMSQDSGANLGFNEKLASLGVVPVPVDFLPLDSLKAEDISDRPYWAYESKFIGAARITSSTPYLYGLSITNFGCGPDSFIIKILQDISGHKPMGQMEIDEHAAEAGLVTRLEAFVDTIEAHRRSNILQPEPELKNIYRGTSPQINKARKIILPNMAPHAAVLAASMQAFGVDAEVLPEASEDDLIFAGELTSGTECLPYRVTLGSFLKYLRSNPDSSGVQGFMSGSYGPCRLGKYAIEQERLIRQAGFELPMCTTVSNNAYRDLNLGTAFERQAWQAIVAVDHLERLLWRYRPYSPDKNKATELFDEYLEKISTQIRQKQKVNYLLKEASIKFKSLADPSLPARPLVGINGEIFLRANRFANDNLVQACEDAGLEVVVSSMSEWLKYTTHRNIEDAMRDKSIKKIITGKLKKQVQRHDELGISREFKNSLETEEISTEELLELSSRLISPRCGSEAVLSLGSGLEWMESPKFAGVISVMPHGCMPGGIVAAMAEKISTHYAKPWISLTYDGFMESNNLLKINNFAELLNFCNNKADR
ncbi:MAG: acyl-CoA dehydratase activase [Dehalococcoidales bacterium]|nr:acyl-CoA dehydratase activase [Dehalococcoidales bacterium]